MVRKPRKKPRKNKGGRPPIYNIGTVKKVREYLDSCEDEEVQKVKQENEGKGYIMYENKLVVKLPTIEGLACFLHISRETVYDWCEKYEKFSDIIEELKAKQANALIANGLSGAYNSTITKLMMGKHGYKESHEHSGEDGKPIKVDISNMLQKAYGAEPES